MAAFCDVTDYYGVPSIYYSNYSLTTLPEIPVDKKILSIYNNKVPLRLYVPNHITTLYLDSCAEVYIEYLPATLEKIRLNNIHITSLPPLPHSVKELVLNQLNILQTPITSLPDSLQTLIINYCHVSITLPFLPNLKYLDIQDCPKLQQIKRFSETLTKLVLTGQTECTYLPPLPNITHLILSFSTLQHLPYLPESLVDIDCYVKICPKRKKREPIKDYVVRWNANIDRIENELARKRCVERCAAVKEALMARTWATERMVDWCWDEEEKAEWQSCA
jgi:hypothetical protein